MGRLKDKVAIVTGAARGMGAAHAQRLVAEGASVLLTDVLDDEGSRTAGSLGSSALYQHLDVRSEEEWNSAVSTAIDRFGRLDILVNNSGIQRVAPIEQTSLADLRNLLDVNLIGTFLGMRAAIAPMRDGKGGSIINISSLAGLAGTTGGSAYAASKHGVIGLTKVAALELASAGIRVNAVCPGPVITPLAEEFNKDAGFDLVPVISARVPLQRCAAPEEMANLVAFLASDEASYCTGSSFLADGGLLAGISFG